MAEFHKTHMISPPLFAYTDDGDGVTVYGWREDKVDGKLEPIVGNPDGPGIGPWSVYFGADKFTVS